MMEQVSAHERSPIGPLRSRAAPRMLVPLPQPMQPRRRCRGEQRMQANDAPYLSTGAAARRLHLSRTTLI